MTRPIKGGASRASLFSDQKDCFPTRPAKLQSLGRCKIKSYPVCHRVSNTELVY
jgi:hypothetical protein